MVIKILGSGCRSCKTLEENVREALVGLDVQIEKVTDYTEIAAYGVMSTPALVVDEKVVSAGKVLKTTEIGKLIENNGNRG